MVLGADSLNEQNCLQTDEKQELSAIKTLKAYPVLRRA
jgi:hypothetical protein